jgi:hypothetical protein
MIYMNIKNFHENNSNQQTQMFPTFFTYVRSWKGFKGLH